MKSTFTAVIAVTALLALFVLAPGSIDAQQDGIQTVKTNQRVITEMDMDQLHQQLRKAVFRAEATHIPPRPYRQDPMTYDGAVVAVTHKGNQFFLTTASWLTRATDISLIDGAGKHHELEISRLDERNNLAFLYITNDVALDFEPVPLADRTPEMVYALLSPQTKYEQLSTVSIDATDSGYYWVSTLAATNGYPVFTGAGELVAVHARRSPTNPATRGEAIGWPSILLSLEPEEGRAPAREPDRVQRGTSLPTSDIGSSLKPSSL